MQFNVSCLIIQEPLRKKMFVTLRDIAVNVTLMTTEIGHGSKMKPARTCKDLMVVRKNLDDGLYDIFSLDIFQEGFVYNCVV